MNNSCKPQDGFTLVEVMITISIIAIILVIAVPNIVDIIRNQRINSAVKTVISMLDFARSDALMAKTDVTVCAYDETDNSKCPLTSDWSAGIKIMRGEFKVQGAMVRPTAPIEPIKPTASTTDRPAQRTDFNRGSIIMGAIRCDAYGPVHNFPLFDDYLKNKTPSQIDFNEYNSINKANDALSMATTPQEYLYHNLKITDLNQHKNNKEVTDKINALDKYADDLNTNIATYLKDRTDFLLNKCTDRGAPGHSAWHTARENEKIAYQQRTADKIKAIKDSVAKVRDYLNNPSNNEQEAMRRYEIAKAKYDRDLIKYQQDLADYNNQPPAGFTIVDKDIVLNNNKIAKSVTITATDKMLINKEVHINNYDASKNELKPILNSKILISDLRGDLSAQTICINALGTTEVKKGNQKCD